MASATGELFHIFNARRVKHPDLQGLDFLVNGILGAVKNRMPALANLKERAAAIEKMEPEVHGLSTAAFRARVDELRDMARVDRLEGDSLNMAFAIAREAALRTLGKRPYPVQLMGAMCMCDNQVAEMATGEGKTLTAALSASIWGWHGRPVHIITVNDYLVARDAETMRPVYEMLGLTVGAIVHELTPQERIDIYRRGVVYTTSKELVADLLRDQIALGPLRSSPQTALHGMMSSEAGGGVQRNLLVPGLFRCIVDEVDSLLIDEAVTPLIISNSPEGNPNEELYRAAQELALKLVPNKDFTIDRTVKTVDLLERGHDRLQELAKGSGFWRGARRREELVTQALTALHCFQRDEQYLVDSEGKVQIIDEFTGRVMADRSWRHGLHQAIEIKEAVTVTADKENLAHLSFQKFFRLYPFLAGMTGTAREAAYELWQIYSRRVVSIPPNKPNIRKQLPTQMFATMAEKWSAVIARVNELNDRGVPLLIGTRSVDASKEVSRRLTEAGRVHSVLNAEQNAEEAAIVAEAGQRGRITVATNMAGRGTDILLGRGVADLGGLHVISTEPNTSSRVDRQLYGRAARQGDPGAAQLFCSAEDDLFQRHGRTVVSAWRMLGSDRVIKFAQSNAERLARFNRRQVLRNDSWMDQSLPF